MLEYRCLAIKGIDILFDKVGILDANCTSSKTDKGAPDSMSVAVVLELWAFVLIHEIILINNVSMLENQKRIEDSREFRNKEIHLRRKKFNYFKLEKP